MDERPPTQTPLVVLMGLLYLALGAGGVWWMRAAGYAPWPEGGLAWRPLGTAVGIGLGLGLALHVAGLPLAGRRAMAPIERAMSEAVEGLGAGNLLALMPGAVLAEELLFRGAMQPAWGLWPAAACFGVLHFVPPRREHWPYPFLAAGAGAIFGLAYQWTGGNLVAPFVAHLVMNLLTLRRLTGEKSRVQG